MRFGPFEFGPAPLGFDVFPYFFQRKAVDFDEERLADEYGVFWFGIRASFYANLKTLQERVKEKRAA